MVQVEKVITFNGHKDAVYALERGLIASKFYSAGADGHVVEWDVKNTENGRLIAKVPSSVYAIRLMEDQEILVVGQNHEGIQLIDLKSNKEYGSLKFTSSNVFDIQIHKNLILVATGEGILYVIDFENLTVAQKIYIGDQNLRKILITSDGNCLVGSSDSYIRKYDLQNFDLQEEVQAHDKSVFALMQFGVDNVVVSGSRDARLRFWNIQKKLTLDETIPAHIYAINDVVMKPGGQYFASASMDKTIKIWDCQQRKLLKVIDKARHQGHRSSVNKLLWLTHNDYLVSCSDDRSIGVWNINIEK